MLLLRRIYFKHLQKNWRLLKDIRGCNCIPSASPCNVLYMSTAKTPAEAVRTVKVFQPALSESEFAKVENEERKAHAQEEEPLIPKFKRERRLGKLDKLILVSIGKYKNLSDVPDKIIVGDLKQRKEVDEEIRNLFLGSVFKYVYFFEYASFFITFFLLGFALYWYNKYQKLPVNTNEETTDKK